MVYLVNIALILFWNILIPAKIHNKKKILCILYCVQWIFLSGFRAYSVGADTYAYKIHYFDPALNQSWAYVFQRFGDYLLGVSGIKDPGYLVFEKLCQIVTGKNYTMFLVIIACVFTIPMTKWIYKYSDNVCMSFMIYSTLFYSFFAITGHRQTIASALVIFAGYECMKEKKFLPLLLLHIVAFFIHKSSVCFIILYFARYIKINRAYWVFTSTAILLSFLFRNQLMVFLGHIMGYDSFIDQVEGAGAYRFTAILFLVYLITMFAYPRLPKDENTHYAVVALSFAMFFTSLTFVDPNAMRVVQYFSVFIMILIPRLTKICEPKSRLLVNMGCYAVLILSLVIKMPSYTFIFS